MRFLKIISHLNRELPKTARFIIGLVLLNIPPITYLSIIGSGIAPIYTAVVFLLINLAALIGYFKLKEVEVDSSGFKIRK